MFICEQVKSQKANNARRQEVAAASSSYSYGVAGGKREREESGKTFSFYASANANRRLKSLISISTSITDFERQLSFASEVMVFFSPPRAWTILRIKSNQLILHYQNFQLNIIDLIPGCYQASLVHLFPLTLATMLLLCC